MTSAHARSSSAHSTSRRPSAAGCARLPARRSRGGTLTRAGRAWRASGRRKRCHSVATPLSTFPAETTKPPGLCGGFVEADARTADPIITRARRGVIARPRAGSRRHEIAANYDTVASDGGPAVTARLRAHVPVLYPTLRECRTTSRPRRSWQEVPFGRLASAIGFRGGAPAFDLDKARTYQPPA
jgi:hypothetical protein